MGIENLPEGVVLLWRDGFRIDMNYFSDEYNIENVTFENIMINGRRASTLEDANICVGRFVRDIKIK